MATDDENHFEYALGFAAVRRWADLSREAQRLLFDEATTGSCLFRLYLCGVARPMIRRRSYLTLPIDRRER